MSNEYRITNEKTYNVSSNPNDDLRKTCNSILLRLAKMFLLKKENFNKPHIYKLMLHEQVQEIIYNIYTLRFFTDTEVKLNKDTILDLVIASNELVQYSILDNDDLIVKQQFDFIDSTIRTLLNKLKD